MNQSDAKNYAKAQEIIKNYGWAEVVGRFIEIEAALKNLGKHVPSPLKGGVDGFRLYKDFHQTGGGGDNSIGFHKTGFGLIGMALQLDTSGSDAGLIVAEKIVEAFEGKGTKPLVPKKIHVPKPPERTPKEKAEGLNNLLSTCTYNPEAIQKYMRSRGIEVPAAYLPQNVFYTQQVFTFYKDKKPKANSHGLVSILSDKNGNTLGAHKIALGQDFGKSKTVETPKCLTPVPRPLNGALIRLYPIMDQANNLLLTGVRGFTEGWEDAVCCTIATKVPTVSGASSTILKNADFEDNFKVGVIFADNDPAGRISSLDLAVKLMTAGKKVIITFPKVEGKDWNDMYRDEGPGAFPRIRTNLPENRKIFFLGGGIKTWSQFQEKVEADKGAMKAHIRIAS